MTDDLDMQRYKRKDEFHKVDDVAVPVFMWKEMMRTVDVELRPDQHLCTVDWLSKWKPILRILRRRFHRRWVKELTTSSGTWM